MNIIPKLTKDCAREDCAIQYDGSSTTLMGWTQTYDKRGKLIEGRDPNTTTSNYHCAVCGTYWKVKSGGGQEDVIEARVGQLPKAATATGDGWRPEVCK